MLEHEKAALPAATDKTATAENLSDMSVTQKTQDGNENISNSGYFAIDGETLMSMELPPINYVVDELLTPGLYILAGGPKAGKSWMMLQFCLSITQGNPIWDFQTNGKSVLYMCLEDSYRRIRRRIEKQDEAATKNLHFLNSAPQLRDGLETLIERHVWLYPDTTLVIIDTFQMVRGATADGGSGYANDYADVRLLKLLADKLNITILLVHHLRKQGDDNPFNMISGTTGLTGAADGSFVLVRDKENTSQYKLAVTGRDIEQKILTLEFDSDACLWDMMSCESGSLVAEDKSPDIVFAVCNYIKLKGNFEGSASELLMAMGDSTTPVNTLTKALNTHKELLLNNGILYEYRRTNSKKIIELAYCT